MTSDKLKAVITFLPFILTFPFTLLKQHIAANVHRWTYRLVPPSSIRSVVVVGGSFAGAQLTRRLAETLPTGWKVVLVEKNSHLNYLFAFPRFSVVPGHEDKLFIPYDGIKKTGPAGIVDIVQGRAKAIEDGVVVLEDGKEVKWDYLAIATGTSSPLPNKVVSVDRKGGCGELRGMQERIRDAQRIAVVGGGAVGVEISTDIKAEYPEKHVTVIHSRDRLLNGFGTRLSDHAQATMRGMGIDLLLGQRPTISSDQRVLHFPDGSKEYDLVIPCTGQVPNSNIISDFSPLSISKTTKRILVDRTLQITSCPSPAIYALGDVAETGGPKMARASFFQAEIVCHNILAQIKGRNRMQEYKPWWPMEGAIKLTLGERRIVMYSKDRNGGEILLPSEKGSLDLDVGKAWKMYGMKLNMAGAGSRGKEVPLD